MTGILESHPFLVQIAHRQYVQAPRAVVTWLEKRRTKRVIAGMFNEVEHAGWDRSKLVIKARHAADYARDNRVAVLRANGREGQNASGTLVAASAAGLKQAVRYIRPQEAEAIDRIDQAITTLTQELANLRLDRARAVAVAWTKGNVVRLMEAKPQDDQQRWLPPRP